MVVYTNGASYVTTLTNGVTKTIFAPINGTYTVKYSINFNHSVTTASATFEVTDNSVPQTITFNLTKTGDNYFYKILNAGNNNKVVANGSLNVMLKEINKANLAEIISILF